jgi:glycosyltransferase involved in cell wall biosynthesis
MNVQFTFPTYVSDGAEGITINVDSLKGALERQGVAITARWPTVRLVELNSKMTHLVKGFATLGHLRAGLVADLDVVHFHTAIPSHSVLARIARALAPGSTCPMVGHLWNPFVEEAELATSHSFSEAFFHRALNGPQLASLGLGSFASIIVASRYQEQQLRRVGYQGPVHLIPNGVDVERFHAAGEGEQLSERAALGLPATGLLVGYYGHLTPWKGVVHLVRGFGEIAAAVPDAYLVIARTGYGTEEPMLREEIRRLGFADRVIFLGKLDPACFTRACDIGVVPAIAAVGTAVFANVLLEWMASGRPVIATGIGTTSEVITHGKDGLLVPPADPAALGQAAFELLTHADLRRVVGWAARETAIQRFNWDAIACQTVQVYQALTEDAEARPAAGVA